MTLREPWKRGESGNSAGRPRGARVKFSEDFLRDFHEAWLKHGKAAIERVATQNPVAFLRAAVAVLPKQLSVRREGDLPEEKRRELITAIIEQLSQGMLLGNKASRTNGH
jgi:hypothetical protein